MTGDDLTPEQLEWFKAIVGRHLRFYGKVRTRMERRSGEKANVHSWAPLNSPST
jgi:hypothetical protein